jgi:transcriptional regulator with XRE-family HTH domain
MVTQTSRREKVGAALRKYREHRQLTQVDAALELGISQAALSLYERGIREPPWSLVIGATRVYDVPIAEFVF